MRAYALSGERKGHDNIGKEAGRERGPITYVIMGRKVMEYTDGWSTRMGKKYLEKPARERRKGLLGGTSKDILPIYNMLHTRSVSERVLKSDCLDEK